MFGAGLMVRPDTMAELLGVLGFFLVLAAGPGIAASRAGMLVLAILTKQTAATFLIAAAAAMAIDGRARQASPCSSAVCLVFVPWSRP